MSIVYIPNCRSPVADSSASTSFCLTANWLHVHHILGTSQRQLHQFENGIADAFEWFNANPKWQEENVEESYHESNWPSYKDEDQEPDESPQESRTALGHFDVTLAKEW